jgi:tetratricopeptide (TPR) repeat protein
MKKSQQSNNNNELIKKIQAISDLIGNGKYTDAQTQLNEYEKEYTDDKNFQFNKVGLLIDTGIGLNNLDVVERGITAGEKNLENKQYEQYKATTLYNLATGLQYKARKYFFDNKTYFGAEEIVRSCINKFQESLSLASQERAFVNLGNFYDEIGKPLESLVQYEKAISRNPKFGMAIGNKARTVEQLASISQYHTGYLVYAYQLYNEALQNENSIRQEGGTTALDEFKCRRDGTKSLFDQSNKGDLLEKSLAHKRFSKKDRTDDEVSYITFCLDDDLYLNLHIFDSHSAASIGDNISTTFITSISDEEADKWVKDVMMRLNEIKESYITGRYILWLSQQKNETLSNISKQSLLVNNLDYTSHNIYTGLLKSSYKEGFSVLDKIANTIDFYLKLSRPEDKISYRNVWYKELKKNQGFDPVITQQNYKLFGLFSVLDELGEKPSETRNTIEHRYQRIGTIGMDEYGAPTFSEFSQETIYIYYKIKCAIVYLFNFINACEEKKKAEALKNGGILPAVSIITDQWLDLW